MTRVAVVYLASPDDLRAARLSIAGRPLAFRIVMAAVRAGLGRVALPAVLRDTALDRAILATPSARRVVDWLTPDAGPPAGDTVLLPAATLVTAPTVAALAGSPAATIVDGAGDGAPLATLPAPAIEPLWRALAAGEPVGVRVAAALSGARIVGPPPHGIVDRVVTADCVPLAEARLLGALGSPIDTAFDRSFHRRLSAPVTRWAVARGVSANVVTIASIVLGLGAAAAVAVDGLAGALVGVVLYVVAVVLDHADGEIARLGFAESRSGELLDISGDTAVHTALVLAMGATAHRASGTGAWLGVIAAVGVVLSAWVMKTSPPTPARVGRLFVALGNRNGFYASLLGFLVGLAVVPALLPAWMVLLAVGTHAYWVGAMLARLGMR